jgi:hypothetical protein
VDQSVGCWSRADFNGRATRRAPALVLSGRPGDERDEGAFRFRIPFPPVPTLGVYAAHAVERRAKKVYFAVLDAMRTGTVDPAARARLATPAVFRREILGECLAARAGRGGCASDSRARGTGPSTGLLRCCGSRARFPHAFGRSPANRRACRMSSQLRRGVWSPRAGGRPRCALRLPAGR